MASLSVKMENLSVPELPSDWYFSSSNGRRSNTLFPNVVDAGCRNSGVNVSSGMDNALSRRNGTWLSRPGPHSQSMLVYKTAFGTRKHMNALHLVLQATAFVLGITGIWAAFKFHSDKGFRGFYSLHSWLGLACVLFFGIQWLVGLASFWYPGIGRINRPKVFPWYAFLGLYNYGLAVAAAETGFVERLTFLQASKIITRYSLEALVVNILGLVLVLLSGCVFLCTITPITNKDHVYRTL